MEINKIYQGDALEVLKTFPDESVDMVITSPPYYGLRNYGVDGQIGLEETFEEYLKKILEIMAELKRVLKSSGCFFLNMGDCYGGMMKNHSKMPEVGKYWETSGLTNPEYQKNRGRGGNQKCMLMQPERLVIKMIDEQEWILRNKIKWAKQVLFKKEGYTKGSVMPTSVKDRFNESGEELYFLVKNKKYYFNLDAVRLKNQVLGVTDFRASGLVRSAELYPNSKYAKAENAGKIDGRVSNHIYQGKFLGNKDAEMFNSLRARTQRKSLEERLENTKNKDAKSSPAYNMKKLLSEVRLGVKPNTGIIPNKVNDPRGNHEGGPGSWRDFKDEMRTEFKDSYWWDFLLGTSHSIGNPDYGRLSERWNSFRPFYGSWHNCYCC